MKIAVLSLFGLLMVGGMGWLISAEQSDSNSLKNSDAKGFRGENRAMMNDKFNEVLAEDYVSVRPAVVSFQAEELNQIEKDSLVFMREEEKLARDVYMTLYEKWNLPIFSNIAQSEQTHTEAVQTLLVKYGLTDPVKDDTIGVFTNANLQNLYNELTKKGLISIEEALAVGATIEDLDIKDLQKALSENDNEDIAFVYENLMRGSRNHLRSFNSQLESRNVTYKPQYISATEFETIISQAKETGVGNGGGNGGGMGGGKGSGRGWGG